MSTLLSLRPVKASILYAIMVLILALSYVSILMLTGANTVIAQITGMFGIAAVAMFITVQPFQRKYIPYNIGTALKLGILGGIFSAGLLLLAEVLIHAIVGIKLAPDAFMRSGLPYTGLQAMLIFELVVYSLLSSLIMFQYYKKPLEHFKYRQQHEHHHAGHAH